MIAKIQSWYYGADGKNPIFRLRKAHKLFLVILLAVAFFSFQVLDFNTLIMRLYSTVSLFSFIIILGFIGNLFGDNSTLILSQGENAVVILVLAFFGGACIGWIITPLYLLLALSDMHYYFKVKKTNPQIAKSKKPVHKDLTKKDNHN